MYVVFASISCPLSVYQGQGNLKPTSITISNLPTNNSTLCKMPHTLSVPYPGFQAVILCGPGVSLTTFTANPEDFPKALVPIANRPMVWYPLDWCYRMGITSK